MYLHVCGACHISMYHLYNMTLWGSKIVILTMSLLYYRGRFKLESLVRKSCVILLRLLYDQVMYKEVGQKRCPNLLLQNIPHQKS